VREGSSALCVQERNAVAVDLDRAADVPRRGKMVVVCVDGALSFPRTAACTLAGPATIHAAAPGPLPCHVMT
jgi:hypothetical protein